MQKYDVIVSSDATTDLDEIADYIASIYRPETGHKYVDRILGKISSLSYSAGTYRISPYIMARMIHPEAKTMSIINHKWTVVFHIEQSNVIVDRIIPSSLIIIGCN